MNAIHRNPHRLFWFAAAGVLLLGLAGLFLLWKKRGNPDDRPPIPTEVISPIGPHGKRVWSKEVVPYPGLPLDSRYRELSHHEIAQRHKALVLRDLPDYITELRGAASIKETYRTPAGWFFVVPKDRIPEFRQYILDLGVPEAALEAELTILPSPEQQAILDSPVEVPHPELFFRVSLKSEGEGDIMGMKFGKSGNTMAYYLANPNLKRAGVRIIVAWKTGNVQFMLNPHEIDDE